MKVNPFQELFQIFPRRLPRINSGYKQAGRGTPTFIMTSNQKPQDTAKGLFNALCDTNQTVPMAEVMDELYDHKKGKFPPAYHDIGLSATSGDIEHVVGCDLYNLCICKKRGDALLLFAKVMRYSQDVQFRSDPKWHMAYFRCLEAMVTVHSYPVSVLAALYSGDDVVLKCLKELEERNWRMTKNKTPQQQ